jgi:hypothetical protein
MSARSRCTLHRCVGMAVIAPSKPSERCFFGRYLAAFGAAVRDWMGHRTASRSLVLLYLVRARGRE